eukprot:2227964-Pyramimonas_sp.AAC.1
MAGGEKADPGVAHHLLSTSWGKFAQIAARHISMFTGGAKDNFDCFGRQVAPRWVNVEYPVPDDSEN